MKLPFNIEQFFDVFKTYNVAVFPMQIIFYLLAALIIYLAIKKPNKSGRIISLILSFLWFWMGIVYHLLFFTAINKAAYFFGALFIAEGLLLLFAGYFKQKFSFRFRTDIYGITGGILILFALIIYPVIGYFAGHAYPSSPGFGLPCPTTIFTFGLFLWVDRKCPLFILIIPLLWSVIGFFAAFSLGVREDIGLLISGLAAVILIFTRNKKNRLFRNFFI